LRDTQANSRKIIKIKPHAINGTLLYMLVSWAYKNSTNRALELVIVKLCEIKFFKNASFKITFQQLAAK
jgi:hypothetical protein